MWNWLEKILKKEQKTSIEGHLDEEERIIRRVSSLLKLVDDVHSSMEKIIRKKLPKDEEVGGEVPKQRRVTARDFTFGRY